MEIYLLRHGIAHDLGEAGACTDEERTLSHDGKAKMRTASEGMRVMGLKFGRILTSPLIRTRETAAIVAETLHIQDRVVVCPTLAPGVVVEKLFVDIANTAHHRSLLLVGHEPDLSLLIARLVWGGSRSAVIMKKGSLCRIDVPRLPLVVPGVLRWLLSPSQLRLIAGKE